MTTRRKKAEIRNLCIRYKILSASINTRLGLPPILFPRRQAWLTRKAQQSGYLMRCLSYQRGLQAGKYRERDRAGGTERSEREVSECVVQALFNAHALYIEMGTDSNLITNSKKK